MVQQAYVEGVSTRKVDALVKSLGCEGISKSQVSRICQELDATVESFLGRPLDGGPYPYLWLDALTQKVREDGRIVNVSVVVATAVNAEGHLPESCRRPASHRGGVGRAARRVAGQPGYLTTPVLDVTTEDRTEDPMLLPAGAA